MKLLCREPWSSGLCLKRASRASGESSDLGPISTCNAISISASSYGWWTEISWIVKICGNQDSVFCHFVTKMQIVSRSGSPQSSHRMRGRIAGVPYYLISYSLLQMFPVYLTMNCYGLQLWYEYVLYFDLKSIMLWQQDGCWFMHLV